MRGSYITQTVGRQELASFQNFHISTTFWTLAWVELFDLPIQVSSNNLIQILHTILVPRSVYPESSFWNVMHGFEMLKFKAFFKHAIFCAWVFFTCTYRRSNLCKIYSRFYRCIWFWGRCMACYRITKLRKGLNFCVHVHIKDEETQRFSSLKLSGYTLQVKFSFA